MLVEGKTVSRIIRNQIERRIIMKNILRAISVLLLVSFLAGCGETVTGIAKDGRRIGGGVRQIFIRD